MRDVSIELKRGEIVALAGMVGAGRSELALGLFGALPISSGAIFLDGRRFTSMSPARAIELGMGLVTEDRKTNGLAMLLDVAANITGPALAEVTKRLLVDKRLENAIARQEIERYRIACRGPQTAVATMSGGNQQKVIVSRWARICRTLLILDEPTRGVDVGAKAEIYRIMRELADGGIGDPDDQLGADRSRGDGRPGDRDARRSDYRRIAGGGRDRGKHHASATTGHAA